jgi:hypothetical protein
VIFFATQASGKVMGEKRQGQAFPECTKNGILSNFNFPGPKGHDEVSEIRHFQAVHERAVCP